MKRDVTNIARLRLEDKLVLDLGGSGKITRRSNLRHWYETEVPRTVQK